MLRPRIIPCLLLKNGGLFKTVKFDSPKYVGDPINAVRIFNEKEVDELIVIDIDATSQNREPNYKMIANLASECRMPLCYGGGIKSVHQVEKLIGLGVEKVALGSAAVNTNTLISDAAFRVGSQSITVVMDVKKVGLMRSYEVFTHNGKIRTRIDPSSLAVQVERLGAGEVLINSIDCDGMMEGYDFDLISKVRKSISLPITALGGAGSVQDINKMILRFGIIGVAAGSLFIFKGKYRAVLINYPNRNDIDMNINKIEGSS